MRRRSFLVAGFLAAVVPHGVASPGAPGGPGEGFALSGLDIAFRPFTISWVSHEV